MSQQLKLDFILNPPPATTHQILEQSESADASASLSSQSWDTRREDTRVPVQHLWLSEEQFSQIQACYAGFSPTVLRRTFSPDSSNQLVARMVLADVGLDWESREQLETKWSVVWSVGWVCNADKVRRMLLQCACGYNNDARLKAHKKRGKQSEKTQHEGSRQAPFDFTACLAHLDITYLENGGILKRIMGLTEHNTACRETNMSRAPAIPLHPHVAEIALQQLLDGASITAVQMKNLSMVTQNAYRGQAKFNSLTANHRYELLPTDFRSLYRQLNRIHGVDVTVAPEHNLNNWLDPEHSHYKPELHASIFKYTARMSKDERLKICIATREMDEAAWKYGHKKQIILDGTFGVCTTRLLLFIVMGVDEQYHGVPLAMFLFSAPTGNRATHAGYNTTILAELLESWRVHLNSPSTSRGGLHEGELFYPCAAITDTDTKERGALLIVWALIFLLLCVFHVRQCWTNKRTMLFNFKSKGESTVDGSSFWREQIISRLHVLENALLETMLHSDALALLSREEEYLASLSQTTSAKLSCTAAFSFIQYLRNTWLNENIWSSWSQYGRCKVASAMGQSVEGVIPTTNHLESFNGVLKRKYIPQWQHSGNRLRFDVFIFHLTSRILPTLFAQRRMRTQYAIWRGQRFPSVQISTSRSRNSQTAVTSSTNTDNSHRTRLMWFASGSEREHRGRGIFQANRVTQIVSGRPYEVWATCAASSADMRDPNHLRYWMTIHPTGCGTCSCIDWLRNGGACKHLWALKIAITTTEFWRYPQQPSHVPFSFPASREDAEVIRKRNMAWYGSYFEALVTPATNAAAISGSSIDSASVTPPIAMQNSGNLKTAELAPPDSNPANASAVLLSNQAALQHFVQDSSLVHPEIDNEMSDSEPEQSLHHTDHNDAVMFQLFNRIEHDLTAVLPTLHGIDSFLDNPTHMLQNLPKEKVSEFEDVLRSISQKLEGRHLNLQAIEGPSRPMGPSTPPQAARVKRNIEVLPPSPEQKQKRKKSYGFL